MGHLKPPKLLLTLLLALTLGLTTASAFSDTARHPARESIDRWSTQYQIINGYQDGTFRPDNNITRGAFAGILNRVMHYRSKSGTGTFSDTKGNYWQDDILYLHAAGVYLGNNGRAQPSDSITRQQAVAMLARAFKISGGNASVPYSDAASISDYAKPLVAEMARQGYLRGVAEGTFKPGAAITRAEFVSILDNMISALVSTPQSYSQDASGSLMINSSSGANLHDMEISGKLYIAPGVTGRVSLTDVEIAGGTVNLSSVTPVATGTAPAITATVVFRVANGAWNNGATEDIVLSLGAREGGRLTLHASDIPAVGTAAFPGFKNSGSWSVTPAEHDLNNGDREVYTFTYDQPYQYHASVTFKVVGGAWSNGSSDDIVIALADSVPDGLGLQASDIPSAGSAPAAGYLPQGTWSPSAPVPHALADGSSEVYTFSYTEPNRQSATVTFKVVGGSWNSGGAEDKVVNLTTTSASGQLQLTAGQIPAAGSQPLSGYKAEGFWFPSTPVAHTLADGSSETYTFTYTQAAAISATVTFKVVNGAWNSGTSADVVVRLSGIEGQALSLLASQIPAVGSRPSGGFTSSGTWSPSTPAPHALSNGAAETYTYTYAPQKAASATVTFKVVNGMWNTGVSSDVVVTLNGAGGQAPALQASQIPSVGGRPSSGYAAEGTWSPSAPAPHTLADGASEVYTFTYTQKRTINATVTFRVVGGMWNTGSSADIVRRYSGTDVNATSLLASQIPSAGGRPSSGYRAEGLWSPSAPEPHPLTDGASEIYTFTYSPQRQVQAVVTFKVVGGSWNNGSSSDITVTLTAQEGSPLNLVSSQIPSAGSRPASGYAASGVWSPSTPVGHSVTAGASEVYTFTYAGGQASGGGQAANPSAPADPWAAPQPSGGQTVKPTDPEDEQGGSGSGTNTNTNTSANAGGTIRTNVQGVTLPANPLAKPISSWPKNRKLTPTDIYTPSEKTGETFTYGSRTIPVYARLQLNQTKAGDFTWNGKRLNYVGSRYRVTFGVDISSYQGTSIDWARAKNNGVQFAFVRLARRTYGVGAGDLGQDSNYSRNIKGAMNAGIMTGAYIFSTAVTIEEAIEEADYVLKLLKGHTINGPVAYDWEINASNYRNSGVSKEVATACAVAFCEKMLANGYAPVVYISQYVGYVKYDMGALRTYLKWYPQYPSTSNATPFPNFRYQVDLWQFSDSVNIPGIGSTIDSNLWFWPK